VTAEIQIDGHRLSLCISPRRAEMLRQLLSLDERLERMAVGSLELRFAQGKVSMRLTESYPAETVSWHGAG
jgi:hypothetical protein